MKLSKQIELIRMFPGERKCFKTRLLGRTENYDLPQHVTLLAVWRLQILSLRP
jgi:hypothetical protein